MAIVRRGYKDPPKKKSPNVYVIIYERSRDLQQALLEGNIVLADKFEIEEEGTLALFYLVKEEEMEKELVCVLKGWLEIRRIEEGVLEELAAKSLKVSKEEKRKSKSVYEPPVELPPDFGKVR